MADLHQHNNNIIHHRQHVPLSISPQNIHLPHMFHQSQSHSASGSLEQNPFSNSHRTSRVSVIEDNDDIISNEFHLRNPHNPSCNDDANLGFIVADSDTRFESDDDGYCDEEESFHLCWDSFHLEDDQITNPNPNPNPNPNSISNAFVNEDFEWEEVDDQIDDEREALSMFFGLEPDDDAPVSPVLLTGFSEVAEQPRDQHDALEWQVLSNVRTFEPNLDLDDQDQDQHDEYDYTEYEMFFGQFADGDVGASGRPPASKTAVVSLSTVVMSQEDVENDYALCAVCKDGMVVGEMATQLPCGHRYHGECILPWLAVRNTCPVCRHELPTDDPDYERRKAERGGHA